MPDFHVTFRNLLHAANLRHGTDDFNSPPKEGVLRIFFALENPTASAGFQLANLGTKGQHATSRPPKPLFVFVVVLVVCVDDNDCGDFILVIPNELFLFGQTLKSKEHFRS